jgi:hypothetical protein
VEAANCGPAIKDGGPKEAAIIFLGTQLVRNLDSNGNLVSEYREPTPGLDNQVRLIQDPSQAALVRYREPIDSVTAQGKEMVKVHSNGSHTWQRRGEVFCL